MAEDDPYFRPYPKPVRRPQSDRSMAARRRYSLVERPMYLMRLAQRQSRLLHPIAELPGANPRAKWNGLPPRKRPLCEVGIVCQGNAIANTIHHKQGREGKLLNDPAKFLGTCRECHVYVEEHPTWAKERGYSLSRNAKAPD